MARPEWFGRLRALFGLALFLSLTLPGAQARASMPLIRQAGPVAISAVSSRSMPTATDCMPCVRCYTAPAPASHGCSGECKEHEALIWWVHVPSALFDAFFDSGGGYARLPVRILYCRWLD